MKNREKYFNETNQEKLDEREPLCSHIAPLIVFLACMAGFLVFFCKAACYIYDDIRSLDQMVVFETDPFMESDSSAGEGDGQDEVAMPDRGQPPGAGEYSYEKLSEQIPAAAYLYIPDSDISYPIMWSEEKGYFLYRDVQGRRNRNGSIFLSDENAPDFSDPINYVFGHNMRSGRMFGQLNRFLEMEYLASHTVCYVVTEKGTQQYMLCYAESVPATHTLIRFNSAYFGTDEYNAYLQALSQRTGVSFPRDAQLIELITCSQKRDRRTIVYGYLCGEEEVDGLEGEWQ